MRSRAISRSARVICANSADGEVAASVFDRYRDPLYRQASYKPYIIAAMIFLAKVKNPQETLLKLEADAKKRWEGGEN